MTRRYWFELPIMRRLPLQWIRITRASVAFEYWSLFVLIAWGIYFMVPHAKQHYPNAPFNFLLNTPPWSGLACLVIATGQGIGLWRWPEEVLGWVIAIRKLAVFLVFCFWGDLTVTLLHLSPYGAMISPLAMIPIDFFLLVAVLRTDYR